MEKIRIVTTFLGEAKYKFELFMVSRTARTSKSMEFLATKRTT